jgi:hypothetical protein
MFMENILQSIVKGGMSCNANYDLQNISNHWILYTAGYWLTPNKVEHSCMVQMWMQLRGIVHELDTILSQEYSWIDEIALSAIQ